MTRSSRSPASAGRAARAPAGSRWYARSRSARAAPTRHAHALRPTSLARCAQLCVELDHWAEALIGALERKQAAGDKLGGIQSYMLAALNNDTIRAAIRAKAIVASLIYVPTLDCLQQLEASPEGADALADACQHIYHWLEHASTDEGTARVLRGEVRLFEASAVESKADARLKVLLGKVCKPAQQGAEPHYDPLVVRMVKAAFAAAARQWHHHSARFQDAACALNPEDVNWRKHGGVLTDLTGQMAVALRGACFTACGVERSHGARARTRTRERRPHQRAARSRTRAAPSHAQA